MTAAGAPRRTPSACTFTQGSQVEVQRDGRRPRATAASVTCFPSANRQLRPTSRSGAVSGPGGRVVCFQELVSTKYDTGSVALAVEHWQRSTGSSVALSVV